MFNYLNKDSDLQYVCYMIEVLGRRTKNRRKDIVNSVDQKYWMYMYQCANVMHCENIEKVIDEYIGYGNIKQGNFDNTKDCEFIVPYDFDVGDTYMWLILNSLPYECTWHDYASNTEHQYDVIDNLIKVYNSKISDVIEDYNTAMFTEDPKYIYQCYIADKIL